MLANPLSRLWKGTSPATRRPIRRAPRVEVLEGRDAPAGIVTAVQTGATLTLTGDAADNAIALTTNLDGSLNLTGNLGTTFNTTIADLTKISGVTNVRVDLGAGNDIAAITDLGLTGALSVNAGAGDDIITMATNVTGKTTGSVSIS